MAGAAAALGHAPVGAPVPAFAALACTLALLAAAPTPRAGFRLGWLAGAGYFAVTLHWIVEPFLVDAARHGWMAPFALVFLAGGLALFWAAAAWLAAWAAPRPGGPARLAATACAVVAAEWLRGWLFTGFPWGLVASLWVDTPLRLHGAWAGPHGLGLLTLVLAGMAAGGINALARTRTGSGGLRHRMTGLALLGGAAGGLAGLWAAGLAMAAAIDPGAPQGAPVLRLVQPNAAQHLKWRADMIPVFWERKRGLSQAGPGPETVRAEAGTNAASPALVIWPEVSLPYLLGSRPQQSEEAAAAAGGAPLLVGAQRFDGPSLRNSAVILAPDGAVAQVYDKHHLVPFGEYFPGGALATRLGLAGLATDALGGFTPGPGPALLDLRAVGLGMALPLICYEAIFPRHARAPRGTRPDWIVQLTNDAWFGSLAGPQQHLAQARMRAVEQGLPLVRVANTGISAVIDPAGRIVAALPLDTHGALDAALPSPVPPTLYAVWGERPVAALVGLVAVWLAVSRPRRGGGAAARRRA